MMHLPTLRALAITTGLLLAAGLAHPQALPESAVLPKAKAAISALQKNDAAAVEATFNANMKGAMQGKSFTQMWQEISAQIGALKSCASHTSEDKDNFRVITHACEFEKSPVNLVIAYDDKGLIGGFFLRPRNP
jgi:hypothetical protein